MKDLLTMTEAAKRMGCSREWVFYLIKKERLKAQKVGGIYILRQKDVDACEVRPRAKPISNEHTSGVSPKKARAGQRTTAKRKQSR